MMRFLLFVLYALTFIGVQAYAEAPDKVSRFKKDGIYYRVIDFEKKECAVSVPFSSDLFFTADTFRVKDVVVPAIVNCDTIFSYRETDHQGYTYCYDDLFEVVAIDSMAFAGSKYIESITIGDEVKSIGEGAFSECVKLKKIEIPSSISRIEPRTFSSCKSIDEVNLRYVKFIGEGAFSNCDSLRKITLGMGIEEIERWAFEGCPMLENIDMTSWSFRFQDKDGILLKDYYILFWVPESFVSYQIPDGVETIGDYVFSGHTKLESVSIPSTVNRIGLAAFNCCLNLKDVIIPNSVSEIDDYAFWGCSSLKNVVLGDGLKRIGRSAFFVTREISKMTCLAKTPPACYDGYDYSFEPSWLNDNGMVLLVPAESIEAYRSAPVWKEFKNIYSTEPLISISFKSDDIFLEVGEEVQLDILKNPVDAYPGEIEWFSSDSHVAEVNDRGLVTLKAPGSAIITARCGNLEATCNIADRASTGLSSVKLNDVCINVSEEGIFVQNITEKEHIVVYSLDGVVVSDITADKDTHIFLNHGMYVVKIGDGSVHKILIR